MEIELVSIYIIFFLELIRTIFFNKNKGIKNDKK